jgi:hypothetical protein
MADEKSGQRQDAEEPKRSRHVHLSDIIVLIEILLGLKAGLGEEVAEEAGNLAQSGLNLGRSFLGWAVGLLRHPLLVWTFRLYFGLLPLLAVIFLILGFETVAYALAVAQMALIIFTTYLLTTFIRRGKGKGLFYRLVLLVSVVEFILLSILNFLVVLPGGLFSSIQYVTLIGLLVAMIPLSVMIQVRWIWGWIIIYLLSASPLIAHLFVPDGALRGWVGERNAWQAYARVATTEPLRIYSEKGKETGKILSAGDTLYVDFNHRVKVYDRLYAFRCYTDFIGGDRVYLTLIRNSNYYHLSPIPKTEIVKAVEIKKEPEWSDSLTDSINVRQ